MPHKRKIACIYMLTNRINGKAYVGQSKNLYSRWYTLRNKKDYKGDSTHQPIKVAIREFGWENFDKEILIECAEQHLDRYEKVCIQMHDTIEPNGYNQRDGGRTGFKVLKPTRVKLSKTAGPAGWTEQGRKCVERTQFKPGKESVNRTKKQWENRTKEQRNDVATKISTAIYRLHAENPGHMKQKPFIPKGEVKQCAHCKCFKPIEDFVGYARWNSKVKAELKTCGKCRKTNRLILPQPTQAV